MLSTGEPEEPPLVLDAAWMYEVLKSL